MIRNVFIQFHIFHDCRGCHVFHGFDGCHGSHGYLFWRLCAMFLIWRAKAFMNFLLELTDVIEHTCLMFNVLHCVLLNSMILARTKKLCRMCKPWNLAGDRQQTCSDFFRRCCYHTKDPSRIMIASVDSKQWYSLSNRCALRVIGNRW